MRSRAAKGGEGGRPAPLASRLHRVPTHFLLNLHGIWWKLLTFGSAWLTGSYHPRCAECAKAHGSGEAAARSAHRKRQAKGKSKSKSSKRG